MTTVLDCFLHWQVTPNTESELAAADAVATHEFGDQYLVSKTTRAIVERALAYDKPLLCQSPGEQVAAEAGVTPAYIVKENLLNPYDYLETEEVNRQIAWQCLEAGWRRVILLTHPHHLWRAGKNLERHGVTVLYPYAADIPYDPENPRKVLSSPFRFVPYETIVRQFRYRPRGWI